MKRPGQRLDAFLAHAGVGSRSEVRRLIRSRRIVTVDGETCIDPGRHVSTETIAVDGTIVAAAPTDVVLLMHKPLGHACSHDVAESPTVFELLDDVYTGTSLQCVGRLDRESSGLLVLTDDGQLNHALTHPKRKVPRRYRLVYEGELVPDAVQRVAEGIVLRDDERPTRPAVLTLGEAVAGADASPPGHAATIVLSEGRYHQIRRMIAALGGRVVSLHRDRIGRLELPADLAPGESRPATAEELERLVTSDQVRGTVTSTRDDPSPSCECKPSRE